MASKQGRTGWGWAAATVIVALLAGCAGEEQRRVSKNLMAAGDYDRAVEAAREALVQDPENLRYLDLLSDAQTAAADFHFEQARKLADEKRPRDAQHEIDRALEYMPAHPGANRLLVTVTRSIRQCEELTEKARQVAAREQWEEAVRLAQQAAQIDQGNETTRELLAHYQSTLVARHLDRARLALDAGDAQACLDACADAKKWDPANALAAEFERMASQLSQAQASASPRPAMPPPAAVTPSPAPAATVTPNEPVLAQIGQQAPTVDAGIKPEAQQPVAAQQPVSRREDQRLITAEPLRSRPAPRTNGAGTGSVESRSGRPDWRMRSTQPLVEVGPSSRPVNGPGEGVPIAGRIQDASVPSSAYTGAGMRPAARTQPPARSGQQQVQHLFRGTLSRDDRRYKKQIAVVDGISIKLKDTDAKPLDADFEIVAGQFTSKPKDVPVGGKVTIRGVSGRMYVMTVVWIDDDQETVHFSLDRINSGASE
ncbi:MAG TPA: hypothetical protein PLV57_12940 [Phycisphaerae bacterium]|nr:hypothetical protein [Phycisphaerae bacterium]